jgi:hypothetical protein
MPAGTVGISLGTTLLEKIRRLSAGVHRKAIQSSDILYIVQKLAASDNQYY